MIAALGHALLSTALLTFATASVAACIVIAREGLAALGLDGEGE